MNNISNLEIRTIKEKEIKKFGSLLFQIFPGYFQSSLENCIQWIISLGKQNIIIARKNRKIVGGLTLIQMGQWFGGSVVPVNGIAVAGVSSENRGKSLGKDVPWHLSRFYPHYKLKKIPPTPVETLHRARGIGLKAGLRYVYTGNVPGDEGENTYCCNCGRLLIGRYGYRIEEFNLEDGECKYCRVKIDGVGMKR